MKKKYIILATVIVIVLATGTFLIINNSNKEDPLVTQFNESVENITPYSHSLLMAGVEYDAKQLTASQASVLAVEKTELKKMINNDEADKQDKLRYEYLDALLEEYYSLY